MYVPLGNYFIFFVDLKPKRIKNTNFSKVVRGV